MENYYGSNDFDAADRLLKQKTIKTCCSYNNNKQIACQFPNRLPHSWTRLRVCNEKCIWNICVLLFIPLTLHFWLCVEMFFDLKFNARSQWRNSNSSALADMPLRWVSSWLPGSGSGSGSGSGCLTPERDKGRPWWLPIAFQHIWCGNGDEDFRHFATWPRTKTLAAKCKTNSHNENNKNNCLSIQNVVETHTYTHMYIHT